MSLLPTTTIEPTFDEAVEVVEALIAEGSPPGKNPHYFCFRSSLRLVPIVAALQMVLERALANTTETGGEREDGKD